MANVVECCGDFWGCWRGLVDLEVLIHECVRLVVVEKGRRAIANGMAG